jgi:hypothetical protein
MSADTRIENEMYNDKTRQMKFVSSGDPYQKLARILGEKYVNYRKKWVEAARGADILSYPLNLDLALNDTCDIKCRFCPHILPPSDRG